MVKPTWAEKKAAQTSLNKAPLGFVLCVCSSHFVPPGPSVPLHSTSPSHYSSLFLILSPASGPLLALKNKKYKTLGALKQHIPLPRPGTSPSF